MGTKIERIYELYNGLEIEARGDGFEVTGCVAKVQEDEGLVYLEDYKLHSGDNKDIARENLADPLPLNFKFFRWYE